MKGRVIVKHTGGLSKIHSVKNHLKYIGYRSEEVKEKGHFDRENDRADMNKFIDRIKENPALKHHRAIKVQKLVFSLRQDDYEAYKRSGRDYKNLVRSVLKEYEEKKGMKLDWIANIHETDGHPHCHVAIKGVSDLKGERGYNRIILKKEDYQQLREIFNNEVDRHALYRGVDLEHTLNEMSRGFEAVTRAIVKEAEKEQMRAEIEKNRGR